MGTESAGMGESQEDKKRNKGVLGRYANEKWEKEGEPEKIVQK